jgi:biotin carboxyl carrier protein
VLSRAVTRSHKELAAGDANLKVLSLPVRDAGETLGVVTVESSAPGQTVDVRTVELLQAALDLVGPVLRLRRSDDRPWPARVAEVLRRAGAWLVGPRQTLWKLAGAAAAALGVVVVTVQVPYRIEAAVSLRPVERRIIAAPFEGTVTEVAEAARAGRRVSAGELLFRLDTSEMELSAVEAQGQMLQAQAQADEAIRRGQGAERQQAEARAEQARARFEFFRSRIDEAAVRAPTDGTLLSGDLSERLGARLTQGEALFEIAPLEEMRVVGTVQDRDIGLLVDAAEAGELRGQLATRAYPGRTFGLTVDRVVPLARAQEGRNVFEVHARIDRAAAWMRPGMEGLAKLDVGDRSLAWIGTRRLADTLRLWLWW